jgi:lipopolysaccharide/colanic/teichoic acid biosynthesis glycosyltransferase
MKPAGEKESQELWSVANDSRMGPVGRFIRAWSIDELPQLFNVLRGDMSIVGPRPERPFFVSKFADEYPGYHDRHRVPVGLTGFAAVNGLRGDTSIAERVEFDNLYIETWSFWLDVKIVIRTFAAVFRRTGS